MSNRNNMSVNSVAVRSLTAELGSVFAVSAVFTRKNSVHFCACVSAAELRS